MNNTIVVIPAYQPTPKLKEVVNDLLEHNFEIVVVNDGSSNSTLKFFSSLKKLNSVYLLHHQQNLGKGEALKTAFKFIFDKFKDNFNGVITVDADGQHYIKDTLKIAESFSKTHELTLGVRDFIKEKVPVKSRIGNLFTKAVFWLATKKWLKDTQTGLRAIPREMLQKLLKLPSHKYDFELDMLLMACKDKVSINEVTINTIYFDNNSGSHFHPIIDSLKIYYVFLRYAFSAIASFLADFIIYSIVLFITGSLLPAIITARILSSVLNFKLNKSFTFKHNKNDKYSSIIKYFSLCIIILIGSYVFTKSLVSIGLNPYAAKILADFILFVFSFITQKVFVFKNKETI